MARPYHQHQADENDPDYDSAAKGCVFSGDVVIRAHDEVSIDEDTAAAMEVLIGAVELFYSEYGGMPPDVERALYKLTSLLENC